MNLRFLPMIFLLIVLQLLWQSGYSQQLYNQTSEFLKANSFWAFADSAGLDFSSGTAVPTSTALTGGLGKGNSAVADPNTGDLLFYSNGDTIWNRNHEIMLNGSGINNYRPSVDFYNLFNVRTRQGALIVPFINDPDKYYVFSLCSGGVIYDNDNNKGCLFYSVVDMTLDNGLGGVVAGQKHIPLDTTSLSEAMIAIPGCNSVWLLVHTAVVYNNPNSDTPYNAPVYKAYQITASGINTTPVLSPGKIDVMAGWLAVSPDRSKVALSSGHNLFWEDYDIGIEVSRFDVQTGSVREIIPIAGGQAHPGGCSFSPDSKKLYYDVMTAQSGIATTTIFQCDVSHFDSTSIADSRVTVVSSAGDPAYFVGYTWRLYRDTLYLVERGADPATSISRINLPNEESANCGYETAAISLLAGAVSAQGSNLGNDVVFPYSGDAAITTMVKSCADWDNGIALKAGFSGDDYTYSWNDYSSDSVLVVYQPGIYWVRYSNACRTYIDTFIFSEENLVPVTQVMDTLSCNDWDNGITLHPAIIDNTFEYLWSDGSADTMLTIDQEGTYWVRYTNGCNSYVDTFIFSGTEPPVTNSMDTLSCGDWNNGIVLRPGFVDTNYQYEWSNNSTDTTLTITDGGAYWVHYTDGCRTYIDTFIFAGPDDPVVTRSDSLICSGWATGIQLDAGFADAGYNYLWSDSTTDTALYIYQADTYWVRYTNGCRTYIDTFVFSGSDLEEPVITEVSSGVLGASQTYDTYQWLFNHAILPGAVHSTYEPRVEGNYRVVVSDGGCSDTSDIYEYIDGGTGIYNHTDLAKNIQVFPNPVQSKLYIDAPEKVTASIFTFAGTLLKEKDATLSISVHSLPVGMYLLHISDREGRLLKVQKFIKAK